MMVMRQVDAHLFQRVHYGWTYVRNIPRRLSQSPAKLAAEPDQHQTVRLLVAREPLGCQIWSRSNTGDDAPRGSELLWGIDKGAG